MYKNTTISFVFFFIMSWSWLLVRLWKSLYLLSFIVIFFKIWSNHVFNVDNICCHVPFNHNMNYYEAIKYPNNFTCETIWYIPENSTTWESFDILANKWKLSVSTCSLEGTSNMFFKVWYAMKINQNSLKQMDVRVWLTKEQRNIISTCYTTIINEVQ